MSNLKSQINNDAEYQKALIRIQNINDEIEMLGETEDIMQEYVLLDMSIKDYEQRISNNKKFKKSE